MKIIKTASGKKLKMSKSEWEDIGKRSGWMKTAAGPQFDDLTEEVLDVAEKCDISKSQITQFFVRLSGRRGYDLAVNDIHQGLQNLVSQGVEQETGYKKSLEEYQKTLETLNALKSGKMTPEQVKQIMLEKGSS